MTSFPSIVAHRGASADAPENTSAAFQEAWAQGAETVECDIRMTKDGAIVLLHDESLFRTTGVNQPVYELTLAELHALDAGSWKAPRWCGEKVPQLRDLLKITPPDKRWTIELKGGMAMIPAFYEELCHAIACGWITREQVDVISFDFAALQLFHLSQPGIRTMYLVGFHTTQPNPSIDSLLTVCRSAGFSGLSMDFHFLEDRAVIEKIHAAGLLCCTWTVNDVDKVRELHRAGVDAITTDLPGKMIRALQESGEEGAAL